MKRIFVTGLVLFICYAVKAQEIQRIKAVDLEKIITESKGPLIINMWATWCKPCVGEIPYFIEEVKNYNASAGSADSVQLILISLDFKEAFPVEIAAFAKKRNFTVPILWLDETDADYFCPKLDTKWQGAIPATLFINNKTGYRKFYEEQISHEALKKEIMAILEKR